MGLLDFLTRRPALVNEPIDMHMLLRLVAQNKALIEQNIALVDRLRVLTARLSEPEPQPRDADASVRASRRSSPLPNHDPGFWRSEAGAEDVDESGVLQFEDAVRESFTDRA